MLRWCRTWYGMYYVIMLPDVHIVYRLYVTYLLVTCAVVDFSRLSLYCPYPMAFQWASRRFLKVLTEVASTTSWGRSFQELMTLWLKFLLLRSWWDLLKDSLRLRPRRPSELSETERWKNWCEWVSEWVITNHQPLFHIMHHLTCGISSLLHSVRSLSSWFTSSCAYHLITVTTSALITYHCLYLPLQT